MARPGIMLYFEIRKPLKFLPDAEKGRLLDAILEYGEHNTIPEFDGETEPSLAMAWEFIQPSLDRDSKAYEKTILKRQYATFCRELKRKGISDVSYDDWLEMSDEERQQMISHDITRYPTTTSTGTTTPTPTGTTTPTPTGTTTPTPKSTASSTGDAAGNTTAGGDDLTAATAANKLKFMYGELGKGVVALTDKQIEELLELMGIEMFDHYVKRLSSFIIKKNASITDHYHTIINWWEKDSTC